MHWALDAQTNDNFASAQPIFETDGVVSGSNAFASKEAGELEHGGNEGGRSIWYQWQAPISGLATIDLAGSLFDSLLAVYRAADAPAVDQLALVRQNDDQSGPFILTYHSRIEFPAAAGVTYYIGVDGANDGAGYTSDGWMMMHYHLVPAPVLQFTRSGQDLIIEWNGPYTLESTTALGDTWTTVPGTPPVSVPIAEFGNRFFRAVHP